MDTLLALHAALGAGRAGRVHDHGRALGYATVDGFRTNYYTAAGVKLGHAERVGGEVVLRETGSRVVARHRIGA